MINQLDAMLRDLLAAELNDPPADWVIDVEVRPPNDAWRAAVNAAGRPGVNVYLAEVREARDQRTSDALRRQRPEPFRLDCHYLVSAWIPSSDPGFATPTVVEDWLLGETIRVLSDHSPLNATNVYGTALPPALEPILVDRDLNTDLLPPEGYANLADFWTGVGQGNVWHPAAHLIVTLPLVRTDRPVGPPVTTLHTTVFGNESFVHIGGTVRTATGDPVPDAWVRLSDPAGSVTIQSALTDLAGRFRLHGLTEGDYRIRAGSPAHPPVERAVTVPLTVGTYDLTFV